MATRTIHGWPRDEDTLAIKVSSGALVDHAYGVPLDADGLVAIDEGATVTDFQNGLPRASDGRLATVDVASATAPLKYQDGYVLDDDNRLVTTTTDPGTAAAGGFVRDSDGAMFVATAAAAASPDGVFEVASSATGSSDPTRFPINRRLVRTDGGRILAVFGKHADGVQLAYRDAGSNTWNTATQGDISDGRIVSGAGTGDINAAIAIYGDTAWVVTAGDDSGDTRALLLRRLTDLDNAAGPTVGASATLRAGAANAGNSKPDIAVETTTGGTPSVAVMWLKQTAAGVFDLAVAWLSALDTDSPTLASETALIAAATAGSRQAAFIDRPAGLGVVSRTNQNNSSTIKVFFRDRDDALTSWTLPSTAVAGGASAGGTYPEGVFVNGVWLTAHASNTSTGVVMVQEWAEDGSSVSTVLTTGTGYWEPSLIKVGEVAYLIMRAGAATPDASDTVVVRKYSAGSIPATDDATLLSGAGGFHEAPAVLRDCTDLDRILFLAPGPGDTANQRQVLAVQAATY